MFSSLLLTLTLVLNVQLYSSAPIPGEFVQSSVVAEEPEEVAGEEGHYPEESIQKKLVPVVAGESASSSAEKLTTEELTAKRDILAIAKDPEPVLTADIDDDVSQGSASQEPLAVAPQASSEEETAPVQPAFAEASPGETTVEVPLAVAVESESPEQLDLEDHGPVALIPIIPSEALEDEASEENAEEEAVAVDSTEEEASPEGALLIVPDENAEVEPAASQEPLPCAEEEKSVVLVHAEAETEEAGEVEPAVEEIVPEQSGPEEPNVILDPEEPAQHEPDPEEQQETVPIIYSEAEQEEDVEEHAEEAEAAVLVVVEENAEEPLPSTTEEEESVVLFPVELETEDEGQEEPAAEETVPQESAPEDPVVIAPVEEEPDLEEQVAEESIPIVSSEAPEEEAPEEHAKEVKAAVPMVLEGNAEEDPPTNRDLPPDEEESVVLFPVELETKDEGQEEPAAEETVPQESVPEHPVVKEGEPDLEEQVAEESIPIVSPEAPEEEAPEEHAKEVEAAVPMVLEGNAEEDPTTNRDLPPDEEESVVPFPVELETKDEGQEEPAAEETVPQESIPEHPVVKEGEPDLEEQVAEESIPIVSPEAPEEEAPEEHANIEAAVTVESAEMPVPIVPEENAEEEPATDKEPLHSTPEEEKSIVRVPAELDSEEEGQEETEPQESAPEESVVVVLVEPTKEPTNEEPAPDDPILVFPLEDSEEDGPEDNTEEGVEAAVQSDPLPHEPALEEDTAPQETEPDDSDPVILTIPVTETPSESETIKKALDPTEEVTIAATEILTEAPAVTDAEVEIVLVAVEGGDGIRIKTHREDFKSAITLIKDKPVAQVSRGTVLGAAFFTLMSFIIIGFVLTTLSKKLR